VIVRLQSAPFQHFFNSSHPIVHLVSVLTDNTYVVDVGKEAKSITNTSIGDVILETVLEREAIDM